MLESILVIALSGVCCFIAGVMTTLYMLFQEKEETE